MKYLMPLHDRVVIKEEKPENASPSGIVIPHNAKDKFSQGIVVAVGPGKMLDTGVIVPLSVQLGDRVLFGNFSGQEVEFQRQDYLILREEDILVTVGDEDAA